MSYGNLLREQGKAQQSIESLEEAAAMFEAINGAASYRLSVGLYNLAASYKAAHRCEDARRRVTVPSRSPSAVSAPTIQN